MRWRRNFVPSMATSSSTESSTTKSWAEAHDLWLEIFVLFNFLCLTGDVLLAHSENHFRNHAEWIPFWFSLAAVSFLLVSLATRPHHRRPSFSRYLGHFVAWASILVGGAGVLYHLESSFFYERTLKSLTYAAPFAAPLAYVGLGCLLLMNRMVQVKTKEWALWVLFFTLGGFAGNFVLSLSDHATNGFYRWSEWIPVFSSAAAIAFLLILLLLDETHAFQRLCSAVLLLQFLVGGIGFGFHAWADFHGLSGSLFENITTGAPPFAPLLFPNLSILGFIGIFALNRHAGPSQASANSQSD
jgi:hypothetical protein